MSSETDENVDSNDEKMQLKKVEPFDKKIGLLGKTPGLGIEFDPDEADTLGAFEETALSLEDAIDASKD